jgi:hypothetical protein
MILVGKETQRDAQQILALATRTFGPDGLGFEVKYSDAASIELRGGGGYIVVRATPQEDISMTEVEIESQEFEHDVEQFLVKI